MTLIADIGNFTKFWSVRFGSLAVVLAAIETLRPVLEPMLPVLETMLPPSVTAVISLVLSVATVVSRGIAQPSLPAPESVRAGE